MRIRKIGTSVPLPSGQVIDSLNGSSTTNAPSIRAVNDRNTLSTDEKIVGYWIDNKPIYSKTYYENFNASTSGVQSKTIDLNISNTNYIWVDFKNSFYITKNDYNLYTSVPIDFCNGTSTSARINNYFRNASTLKYALDIYGMRAGTAYVTFLYTKTTD